MSGDSQCGPEKNHPANDLTLAAPVVVPLRRLTRRQVIVNVALTLFVFGVFVCGPWIVQHGLPLLWTPDEEIGDAVVNAYGITFPHMEVDADLIRMAIRKQPDAKRLVFDDSPVSSDAWALFDQFPKLESLQFSGKHMVELDALPPLPKLTSLAIQQGKAPSKPQLQSLSRHPKLVNLSFWGSPIDDAGVAEISPLSRLQGLTLSGTKVTDACLADLLKFPKLGNNFELRDTEISATALCQLFAQSPYRRIGFTAARIQPTLAEWIVLFRSGADDLPFEQLPEIRALQALAPPLRTSALAPGGIDVVDAESMSWVSPEFHTDEMTNETRCVIHLDMFHRIPTLEVLEAVEKWNLPLSIQWQPAEDIALLDRLVSIPKLEQLHLTLKSADAVERLSEALRKVTHPLQVGISFEESTTTTFPASRDATAAAFAHIPQLYQLQWFGMSEASLVHFQNHPQLSILNLYIPLVTDEDIEELRSIQNLTHLILASKSPMTKEQVEKLLADRPKWKQLHVHVADPQAQAGLTAKFPKVSFFFSPPVVVQAEPIVE